MILTAIVILPVSQAEALADYTRWQHSMILQSALGDRPLRTLKRMYLAGHEVVLESEETERIPATARQTSGSYRHLGRVTARAK